MTEQEEKIMRSIRRHYEGFEEYFREIDGKDIDINATDDEFQNSFLHRAISNQKYDVASDLIRRGIDVNLQDTSQCTVLHYLADKINLEITAEILQAGGNPNIENEYGLTPLHKIVCSTRNDDRKYEMAEMFLKAGDDIRHVRSSTGDTILEVVEENFSHNERLMEVLEKYL